MGVVGVVDDCRWRASHRACVGLWGVRMMHVMLAVVWMGVCMCSVVVLDGLCCSDCGM